VTAGVQEELMAYLLSRGASVGDRNGTGAWSTLINACHANGRPAAAEFLAARADTLDLEAAAGVGRLDTVQSFFEADGRLKPGATVAQMKDGLAWACEYGRTAVVEFLLDHGLDAGTVLPRPHGQTGLHWAAFNAHVGAVRALLKRNPPIDARDRTFESTPLGWALHAWQTPPTDKARQEDYYQTVELLVGAGATVEPAWITEELKRDPRMRTALRLT
jgi:ankyrin repeat protein